MKRQAYALGGIVGALIGAAGMRYVGSGHVCPRHVCPRPRLVQLAEDMEVMQNVQVSQHVVDAERRVSSFTIHFDPRQQVYLAQFERVWVEYTPKGEWYPVDPRASSMTKRFDVPTDIHDMRLQIVGFDSGSRRKFTLADLTLQR